MVAVEVEAEALSRNQAACEERRLRKRRDAESRIARAEAKVAAVEKRMAEMQLAHDEAAAADAASYARAVASVNDRAERITSDALARMEAARAERAELEACMQEAEGDVEVLGAMVRESRKDLMNTSSEADGVISVALHAAEQKAAGQCLEASREAEGVMRELQGELRLVRQQQEVAGVYREHVTGVTSMRRDARFRMRQAPRPLPFDLPSHETVFDGCGTFGKRPVLKAPRGFQADLMRARYMKWGISEAPP